MNRRGFLQGMLAAGVAPAFVGSKVLMPVRAIVVPELAVPVMATGNSILTFDQITRLALQTLEQHMGNLNYRLERECFESFDNNQIVRVNLPNRCLNLRVRLQKPANPAG